MKKSKFFLLEAYLGNTRGMGLLSTLGGLALAAVVAGVVSYSVYNTKFAAKSAGAADLCSDRASSVLNALSANSNKSLITNWHPTTAQPTPPPNFSITGQPRLPGGVSVAPLPGPGVQILPGDTNMWALIESSYNWLSQVYNDPTAGGVCSLDGNGLDLTANALTVLRGNGFKVNATPTLRGEQIFVNLKRVNQRTGQVDCTRPILMVPPSPGTFAAGVDPYGLRVTVTVAWRGTDDIPRNCRRETTLQPDGDRQAPNMDATALFANTTLNPAAGACGGGDPARVGYCQCTGSMCVTAPCAPGDGGCQTMGGAMDVNPLYGAFTQQSVRRIISDRYFGGSVSTCARAGGAGADFSFSTFSTEPATLFTCGITRGPEALLPGGVGNHSQCVGFSDGVVNGNLPAASIQPNQPTGVRFIASNVPVGSHRFSFQAIDHARNTATTDAVVNVLTPCPPEHTVQFCPGGPTDHPNVCGEPAQCPGTRPPSCPNPELTACGDPVPVNPGSCAGNCGLGTGPATGLQWAAGDPTTIQGSYLDTCGYCTQVGTCVPSDGPDLIAGTPDDTVCASPGCAGANPFPAACPTTNVAACPIIEFRPNGVGPYVTGSFPQTGSPVEMRVAGGGFPAGCTVEYGGHQDGLTNAVIGPVNTTLDPTYNRTFTPAGPGTNFDGYRTMELNCGGSTSAFEFRSQCAGATCNFTCVQATCR